MNILFVCSARTWGGNEKWSLMAMRELEARGHRVYLLARKASLWRNKLKGGQIRSHFFLHFLNPWSYLYGAVLLKSLKIERVLSTKRAEYVLFGVLTRFFNIRHLIRLGIVRTVDTPFKRWVYGRLNDGIVVNALRIRDTLAESGAVDISAVKVIYNGIPDLPESPVTDFSTKPLRIVSVGHLQPRKGFHKLIEALSLLPDEHRNRIELTILGEGEQRGELEAQVRRCGLEQNIHLPGFSKNVAEVLRSSGLFVLVSENEGLSNAVLEALSHGLPVMTTDSGGTKEVLTDGEDCLLIDGTPEDIAAKIQLILEDSVDLRSLSEHAFATARNRFSLTRMGNELEMFLQGSV